MTSNWAPIVCGSSKEVSAKRKRDKDEVEDVDEDSE